MSIKIQIISSCVPYLQDKYNTLSKCHNHIYSTESKYSISSLRSVNSTVTCLLYSGIKAPML